MALAFSLNMAFYIIDWTKCTGRSSDPRTQIQHLGCFEFPWSTDLDDGAWWLDDVDKGFRLKE